MKMRRRLGLWGAAALVALSTWACVMTRHSDGTVSLEFAPDMTITAFGLEDAFSKLTELLDKCIAGNYHRPCTPTEMAEITDAIDSVLERKPSFAPRPGASEFRYTDPGCLIGF